MGRPKTHGYCSSVIPGERFHASVYNIWCTMHSRCSNPKSPKYPYYGGRGIKVCERWAAFENFIADMGDRPEGMTLDRKNVDGDYEPSNCRWVTTAVQRRNRKDVKLEPHEPAQIRWLMKSQSAKDVAKFFELNLATVYKIKHGQIYAEVG